MWYSLSPLMSLYEGFHAMNWLVSLLFSSSDVFCIKAPVGGWAPKRFLLTPRLMSSSREEHS